MTDFKAALYFHNPWWRERKVPSELISSYFRRQYHTIREYLERLDRIVILKGPRRTGKSTILYQIADHLVKNGVSPFDILFLSFDDIKVRGDLDDLLAAYEQIRRKTLKEGVVYCFLDEVHFLPEWSAYIKKYFDRRYPVKFLVTSSSASLFRKTVESLAGRTVEEVLLPLSFREYALYHIQEKEFADFLEQGDVTSYEKELRILFERYLQRGGFPHLLDIESPPLWLKLMDEDVVGKVIYRDLVDLYNIREPEKLEKTLLYLARITGQLLNVSNLSQDTGVSRPHLEKYIFYLEQAYLIFQLDRFSISAARAARGLSKIHLIDPGIVRIFGGVSSDFILESVVARHLLDRTRRLHYYRNGYEIDLVAEIEGVVVPYEVKNKDMPEKRDFAPMLDFMEKAGITEGYILCRSASEDRRFGKATIRIRPVWLWALMQ